MLACTCPRVSAASTLLGDPIRGHSGKSLGRSQAQNSYVLLTPPSSWAQTLMCTWSHTQHAEWERGEETEIKWGKGERDRVGEKGKDRVGEKGKVVRGGERGEGRRLKVWMRRKYEWKKIEGEERWRELEQEKRRRGSKTN